MKTKSILIAVLNQGDIRPEMADLLMKLTRQNRYDVTISYPCRKPISNNRNMICKDFLDSDHDYLLMLDNDCIPTEDILKLADYDKDIIGAVCFGFLLKRIIPFVMQRSGGKYSVKNIELNGGVVECDAIGSGVMMIARRVLEDIPFPFRNEYDPEGIKTRGLDFNFCTRAQDLGYKVWVDTDNLASHWTTMDLKTQWTTFNEIREEALQVIEAAKSNDKPTIQETTKANN